MNIATDLFPDNPKKHHNLRGITRENAANWLARMVCPKCDKAGSFDTFVKGPHLGILCTACGRAHPFGTYWIPSALNAWKRGK